MNDLSRELPAIDTAYVRRCYDEALGYANFVKARLDKALDAGVIAAGLVDLTGSRANVRDLINEFAEANAILQRRWTLLLEAMEWDEDQAKEEGVTERVQLHGYKQMQRERAEREAAYWYEHDVVEGQ